MVQAPVLSPDLVRQSVVLARALSAAVRNWALYPPEHPAVGASVRRLSEAVQGSTAGMAFSFGVTPQTLLVAGLPLPEDQPVVEAARLLHDRDILQITFLGAGPDEALQALLQLLSTPADELRVSGGPAPAWERAGHASIAIEQIDYEKILEDREIETPADRHDDVWRSLVQAMTEGRAVFDEQQQRCLLEISGSPEAISDLATAVVTPKCNIDGSPLITTHAATVLAVFRHISSIVQVMDPDRLPDVMRNIATAAVTLDPHVVLQMMQTEDQVQESPIVERLASVFDDEQVAQLLATALAKDSMATTRLAQVLDTIAPDVPRKQRVLTMTRSLLSEHDFGKGGQFKAAWASMENLLLNYNEKPYVSGNYQTALAEAGGRGDILAARDLPPELAEWIETLGQDNVRSLSVLLITDLLHIEANPDRAAEIARDVAALGEDLLLAGAFDDLLVVVKALSSAAESSNAPAPAACRAALTDLGGSSAMNDAADLLGDLDASALATFTECCVIIGPATVPAFQPLLEAEHENAAFTRACDIVRRYGAAAIPHLAQIAEKGPWFVQRNAADLLGATRSPEAVGPLQGLLRRHDVRVLRAAVSALAGIDDPSAARAIQTALRAAVGRNRQAVVEALVAERDPRVIPMLVRILSEADSFGQDHQTVLDALDAVRQLADARAVPSVSAVMTRKHFFRRKKARALKQASVDALRAIGTPRAQQALDDAARTGDRVLRKIIRQRT